jgi:CubicO group peptidase (beta-lactamase class C family)
MDPARMPVMAENDVGGTGTHNLKHWTQIMRSGKFKDMTGKNYNVSALMQNLANTDLLLFVGANDALSQPEDFAKLVALLPQEKLAVKYLSDYNHLDYMWAKDSYTIVNTDLYKWLNATFGLDFPIIQ